MGIYPLVLGTILLILVIHRTRKLDGVTLSDFSDEEIKHGKAQYLAWFADIQKSLSIGMRKVYLTEENLNNLETIMDLQFACCISKLTNAHLVVRSNGVAYIKIKKGM